MGAWKNCCMAGEATASVALPSVAGETTIVPDVLFIERQHRGSRGEKGAYLPPCSGRQG